MPASSGEDSGVLPERRHVASSQHGPDAGQKLGVGEWLCPSTLTMITGTSDRVLMSLEHVEAAGVRQDEVQDHEVRKLGPDESQAVLPLRRGMDGALRPPDGDAQLPRSPCQICRSWQYRRMQRNMLGAYGPWMAARVGEGPGRLSFRNPLWADVDEWKKTARETLTGLLCGPGEMRPEDVRVHRRSTSEELEIEELSWQLACGPRTQAYLLKPAGSRKRLPGILALHDHGGNKHFGKRKIARVGPVVHPLIKTHQDCYYGGVGWANEMARRGFAVLVHDVFPFESRRVLASDLPGHVVRRLMSAPDEVREVTPQDLAEDVPATQIDVPDSEPEEKVAAYNAFAGQHEGVIAKSLFCAGLTWPGLTLAEDRAALDYLAQRPDVDPERLGCGGLSGGGLRTVFLAGLDPRIRVAVCAGFMSTWRDFLLNTSYTHTWMMYVPGLPALLDFPEVLAVRVPLPTLVLSTTEDPLFTSGEVRRAGQILEEIFRKAGASEGLSISIHAGAHKFDLPMQAEAFQWVERWLT